MTRAAILPALVVLVLTALLLACAPTSTPPSPPAPAATPAITPRAGATVAPAQTPAGRAVPSAATVSAAATRVAVATPLDDQILSVVELFFAAYRAGQQSETLAALTPRYAAVVRTIGEVRRQVGAAPADIQSVQLEQAVSPISSALFVDATVRTADGERILRLELRPVAPGWRIDKIETVG